MFNKFLFFMVEFNFGEVIFFCNDVIVYVIESEDYGIDYVSLVFFSCVVNK